MNDVNTNNMDSGLNSGNIQRLSVLRSFKPLLNRLRSHADCHNRQLHYDQYVSLLLLYFFNPTFTGLRSIQCASELKNVQNKLGIKCAQAWVVCRRLAMYLILRLLIPIINELALDADLLRFDNRLNKLDMEFVAVDGSLLKALPKMLWALRLDEDHRAVKIHLEFNILKGVPLRAQVTDANANERTQLQSSLTHGKLYCLDAGYREYRLLDRILFKKRARLFVRLQDNASYEIIEEHQLSDADRKSLE